MAAAFGSRMSTFCKDLDKSGRFTYPDTRKQWHPEFHRGARLLMVARPPPGPVCSARMASSRKAPAGHVEGGWPAHRAAAVAALSAALLCLPTLVQAADASPAMSLCQLADVSVLVEQLGNGRGEGSPPPFVMSGMSVRDFDVRRYMGRWYEVLSIKKGFAGQGQEDCHCTQGEYSLLEAEKAVEVATFCVHGSPTGYLTGIRGRVACLGADERESQQSPLERQQMIQEKCFLRFPSIPFIPKSVYNVIATDYDNFAIVSGAKGLGFVQVYSRVPTPGSEFLKEQLERLETLGYALDEVRETPQDCPVIPEKMLEEMMSPPAMQNALDNVLLGKMPAKDDLQSVLDKGSKNVTLGGSPFSWFTRTFLGL